MTARYKPFSLVYDAEPARPGERTFAGPDPTDAISEVFARRLRDVQRAGRLRNQLVSAEVGAWEAARLCRYTLHQPERADAHLLTAGFYAHLLAKVCRLEARARGEAL